MTGVQTCALPIYGVRMQTGRLAGWRRSLPPAPACREGVNVLFPGTEEIQKVHAHVFAGADANTILHAIKAFARLRRAIEGLSTPKGIEEYLILLSLCQTCKYMGVDFLDFLRPGEKDIHAFAGSRRGRRRRTQTWQPSALPTNTILDSGEEP